jgi:hypothetical protein
VGSGRASLTDRRGARVFDVRARRTPLVLLLLTLLAGCTHSAPHPAPSAPAVRWADFPLPVDRTTVRDVARCGDQWLAVGALRLADDPTIAPNEQRDRAFEPAAWLAGPTGGWQPLTMRPVSYYGERAILRSVACRDGVIVAVGGASGGAHGNLRVTTWHGTAADRMLTQNPLPAFELFGGNSAIGVGQIAAGPDGSFAIEGNWLDSAGHASAAVWHSADGHDWRRLPDDPTRSSNASTSIRAVDLYADDDGYLLAGEQRAAGVLTPYLLRSSDGLGWARVAVPHDGGLLTAGRALVGNLGSDVLVWRQQDGQWSGAGGFVVDDGPVPVQTSRAGRFGTHTVVAACGGRTCGLWAAADGSTRWDAVAGPTLPQVRPTTTVRLVTDGTTMLLLSDDGTKTHFYLGSPAA